MTLDLAAIAGDIAALVRHVDPASEAHRYSALRQAWESLDSDEVSQRIESGKTTFLVPGASEDYRGRASLPPPIDEITVCATDGSFVLPSRHSPARYYLINTGVAKIHYGQEPSASITSHPQLFYREADLLVPDPVNRIPVNGSNIGPKRAAEEIMAAASAIEPDDGQSVVLQDGTLILWMLETLPEPVRKWTLPDFLYAMDTLRDAKIPIASYISAPGSRELLNVLRIAVCDYPPRGMDVNCDHCRRTHHRQGTAPACDILPPVADHYLLREIAGLQPGERTALFASRSTILQQYGEDHQIHFFYVHSGYEIGRVEVPAWVQRDPRLVDLVHRTIYDQCQLGRGYPTVLQEAHEAAVLNVADRRLIEDIVERELAAIGVVLTHTGKDSSKRVRAV